MATVVVVLAVAAGSAVWWFNRDDTSDTKETEAKPSTGENLCENLSQAEFDDTLKTAGEEGEGLMVGAYIARRCSLVPGSTIQFSPLSYWAKDPEKYAPGDTAPVFFEEQLTVAGLYSAWNTVMRFDGKVAGKDPKDIQEGLQEDLGHALALSTDPTTTGHLGDDYRDELLKLATAKLDSRTYASPRGQSYDPEWKLESQGPTVYGWSLLAPLLRYGDFDAEFLTPVAIAAVEFDHERDGDWSVPGEKAVAFDPGDPDAETGMSAVLAALSRNDEAAKSVAEATGDERVAKLAE